MHGFKREMPAIRPMAPSPRPSPNGRGRMPRQQPKTLAPSLAHVDVAVFSREAAKEFSRGRKPTVLQCVGSESLGGATLKLDVKIERHPSGAFGSLCDVSGGFHPRLNSSATSWLMKIATSKFAHRTGYETGSRQFSKSFAVASRQLVFRDRDARIEVRTPSITRICNRGSGLVSTQLGMESRSTRLRLGRALE